MLQSKSVIITVILSFAFVYAKCQNFSDEYKSLTVPKNDTSVQINFLRKWEAAKPDDPDLLIAYFNYYALRSKTQLISVEKNPRGELSFRINDAAVYKQGTYINPDEQFTDENLERGFQYINKGIRLYPNRLDMRFGKIYMLGASRKYNAFTDEIVAAVEYDAKINSGWKWKEDGAMSNPKQFFLSSLQTYVSTLYNSGDEQLPLMRKVCEMILKYNPNQLENYSDIAISYVINGEVEKGLSYLLKAETIAPNDVTVLNNIADTYRRKKDKANATRYYNKVIKIGGDSEAVSHANEQLKTLN